MASTSTKVFFKERKFMSLMYKKNRTHKIYLSVLNLLSSSRQCNKNERISKGYKLNETWICLFYFKSIFKIVSIILEMTLYHSYVIKSEEVTWLNPIFV